ERPSVQAYLPPDGADRIGILVELIHADLELRLKAGEKARVEAYLRQYPELASNSDIVFGLLQAEYTHRVQTEPALTPDEICQRFPELAELFCAWAAGQPTAPPAGDQAGRSPEGDRGTGGVAGGGRFRVLHHHGRGGLGDVFLARDQELDREVALKTIQA